MNDSPHEASAISWSGGCQCGALRYKITAKPRVMVCHCRMCQKASGAPFVVLAAGPGSAVVWTRGAPARFRSSDIAERWFCSACGTPLAFGDLTDDDVEIMVGSLDDPSQAAPVEAAGTESYIPWVDKVPGLPRRTTDATVAAAGRNLPLSYQHPDHDTKDGWTPPKQGSSGPQAGG